MEIFASDGEFCPGGDGGVRGVEGGVAEWADCAVDFFKEFVGHFGDLLVGDIERRGVVVDVGFSVGVDLSCYIRVGWFLKQKSEEIAKKTFGYACCFFVQFY